MPPEAFSDKFSEMSDIFSFAVLMYEVMSLVLPHAGKSTVAITELARGKFKVSKALEKRGVTAAEQEQEWLEENPLHTRRPDLGLVQHSCNMAAPLPCWTGSWNRGRTIQPTGQPSERLSNSWGTFLRGDHIGERAAAGRAHSSFRCLQVPVSWILQRGFSRPCHKQPWSKSNE